MGPYSKSENFRIYTNEHEFESANKPIRIFDREYELEDGGVGLNIIALLV